MGKFGKNQSGFSAVEAILILVIIGIIGFTGYFVWHAKQNTDKNLAPTNSTIPAVKKKTAATSSDIYTGWKTAASPRAKFSIKYPASWTYAEQVGDKDGVEHITVSGTNMHLSIDSFVGTDATDDGSGGTTGTTCADCQKTLSSQSFTAGKLGTVNLQTVTYTLDSGVGNALILRQSDGTYYLASPDAKGVKSSFRAISVLNSEQAYQNETPAQFSANPDYVTAQEILKSIAY